MIECAHLQKSFHTYRKQAGFLGSLKSLWSRELVESTAVRDFDLSIGKGELVGLLGPNGAGKTTLMKMLTGIIVPTSGQMRVLGFDPSRRLLEFRKKIALVMGQKSQLWWDIPAMDSFLLLKAYYELSQADFHSRLKDLTESLQVAHLLNVHVRKLSLGERMKMELIASLLHRPEVIFLDEPTIGLDLVAQRTIRNFLIQYHAANGATIILTSHYMADVDALCSRIVLIQSGEKRFDGDITKFARLLGQEKFVTLVFGQPVNGSADAWQSFHPVWNEDRTRVELRIPEESLRTTIGSILQHYPVVDLHTEKLPIERVMETLMQRPEILKNG